MERRQRSRRAEDRIVPEGEVLPRGVRRETYLGRGGKLVHPKSESAQLDVAMKQLDELRDIVKRLTVSAGARERLEDRVAGITGTLRTLREQVSQGYHRNGALMIYGNPPRRKRLVLDGEPFTADGEISREAHAILYRHIDDGKPYKHDFETPVSLVAGEIAGQRVVVIVSPDGKPVWGNF